MANFEERVFVSQFDIQPNGCIVVRKTTEVLKDGEVISQSYWRTMLLPNDPQAATVLDEPYYLNIANYAWSQPSPVPYNPNPPTP
jgi:archaellum component FlaF (FlaF/FlaG flagellin family)